MDRKPKVCIIDADSIAFRSASVSEERRIDVTHVPTGIVKSFKNRTEFKDLLKKKNKIDKIAEYSIQDTQEAQPVEYCLHTIKSQINKIQEAVGTENLIIYVGGKSSYREQLPLPKLYKGSRTDMIRPLLLKDSKDYLINFYKAKEIQGIEADDMVIAKACEMLELGYDVTVASIDKDTLQLDGISIYDFSKEKLFKTEGHYIEPVYKNDKLEKIVGSGVGFLCMQMVYGDIVDFWKPTDLANIKYGVVSAYNDLKGCKTPQDFLEVVKSKYQEWYPEPVTYKAWDGEEHTKNWKELLQLYFQCAYMLRSPDDKAIAKDYFAKYGVEL